jgi:hypothetical protein
MRTKEDEEEEEEEAAAFSFLSYRPLSPYRLLALSP